LRPNTTLLPYPYSSQTTARKPLGFLEFLTVRGTRNVTKKSFAVISLICIGLAFVAGVVVALLFQGGSRSLHALFERTGAITGGAFFSEAPGKSEILRGLQIALCRPTFKSEIASSLEGFSSCQASTEKAQGKVDLAFLQSGGWVSPLLLSLMKVNQAAASMCYYTQKTGLQLFDMVAAQAAIKVVRSDVEGKFEIHGIQPGEYLLCATNWTPTYAAYWLVRGSRSR
jgi:hypothetical protein